MARPLTAERRAKALDIFGLLRQRRIAAGQNLEKYLQIYAGRVKGCPLTEIRENYK